MPLPSAPLACPECGRDVPLADVSMDRGVALCRHCSRVFGLQELLGRPARDETEGDGPPAELVAALPPPDGVTVAEQAGGLVVKRRWFHATYLGLLAFAVFWDGFLVVWYAAAFAGFASGEGDALFALLFPLLHVAAGVGITWMALAGLLNRTTVTVRGSKLRVQHGPVPWAHPPVIPTARLRQLFVVQRRGSKGAISYELHARLTDGSSEKLLGGLRDLRQGRYIEKRVEAFVGIRDRIDPEEHVGD